MIAKVTSMKNSQALAWLAAAVERGAPLQIVRQGQNLHVRDIMVSQDLQMDICIAGYPSGTAATLSGAAAHLSGLTAIEGIVQQLICSPDPTDKVFAVGAANDPLCVIIWLKGLWEDLHSDIQA